MSKFYEGRITEEGAVVTVDGRPLDPMLHIRSHSPTGFSWGYGGSGPSQLALAILVDLFGKDSIEAKHYQAFKWEVVSRMPKDRPWALAEEGIRPIMALILKKEMWGSVA